MKKNRFRMCLVSCALVAFFATGAITAMADGTETLGDPANLVVAGGSGIAAGGTGLVTQPGTIEVTVPDNVTIRQVLLYWSGELRNADDDTIVINGTEVTGQLIGGPTFFYNFNGDVSVSAYRADITDLHLVITGTNSLTVEGLAYDDTNDGAGILVIYDDGVSSADIQIRDGVDLAFFRFPQPRETCVPQTFTFAAASVARTASLVLYAGSVAEHRPNALLVTVNGVTTTLNDVFGSFDGADWDTLTLPVEIPAGATSVIVQPVSTPSDNPLGASIMWVGAALSVPQPSDQPPFQGCTPGFWKQCQHFKCWVKYCPLGSFNRTFGVKNCPDMRLLTALWLPGGGKAALNRHAVAALLNAASPSVNYKYTQAEVISMVQQAYATKQYEQTKNLLEEANEAGCPLGRCR